MALPELIANSPTPGSFVPITTLNAAVSTTPAANTQETWTFAGSPPSALSTAGQFRFVVDSEILLDITGATGTSRTVLRGQEGSTVATHANGASVYHDLTAAGLLAYLQSSPNALVSKTDNYTASAGQWVFMTVASKAVTLPTTPASGSSVSVTALATGVTVARGGSDTITGIDQTTANATTTATSLGVPFGGTITLVYSGATSTWYVSTSNVTIDASGQTVVSGLLYTDNGQIQARSTPGTGVILLAAQSSGANYIESAMSGGPGDLHLSGQGGTMTNLYLDATNTNVSGSAVVAGQINTTNGQIQARYGNGVVALAAQGSGANYIESSNTGASADLQITGVGGGTMSNLYLQASNVIIGGSIPTSDPHSAGHLWRSGNTLMISTG